MNSADAADCVTLWIGESLGPVERACFRSALRQGHSVALYCYDVPKGVPSGVELRDASELLPEQNIVHHCTGSVALFSDWFRYELQRRALGTWIDTDMYFVAPIDMRRTYLFGRQELRQQKPWRMRHRETINGGVLRIPADSPILPILLGLFEGTVRPDWLPWPAAVVDRVRSLVTGQSNLPHLPWGMAGPFAITALAKRYGLGSLALPREVFYPVSWYNADWIVDPAIQLEDVIAESTVGVHLWNERIKSFKDARPPRGSFLQRLHDEGA